MVPARNLHLPRDAHGLGVTAAPPSVHMAQEPLDQHREPSKQPAPLPPQEERQAGRPESRGHREEAEQQLAPRPLLPSGAVLSSQEAAGTSGSSSGGSSGNGGAAAAGGWLSLGLSPASPGSVPPAGSHHPNLFTYRAGPPPGQPQPRQESSLPGESVPTFLRPAAPGIPQASITLPAPRAGPPWLLPWSQAAAFVGMPAPPTPTMMLPFAHRTFYTPGAGAGASGVDTIRVVLPPAGVAAAAGVWFVLQAAPHQGREPFLPQIPRSYLRIKDVRVTVGLLIKYLVRKLGLEDESEVEIICRGRPLLPFLTLQHVRDSIWCQGDAVSPSVAPDMSSVANHLMVLQYGRRP